MAPKVTLSFGVSKIKKLSSSEKFFRTRVPETYHGSRRPALAADLVVPRKPPTAVTGRVSEEPTRKKNNVSRISSFEVKGFGSVLEKSRLFQIAFLDLGSVLWSGFFVVGLSSVLKRFLRCAQVTVCQVFASDGLVGVNSQGKRRDRTVHLPVFQIVAKFSFQEIGQGLVLLLQQPRKQRLRNAELLHLRQQFKRIRSRAMFRNPCRSLGRTFGDASGRPRRGSFWGTAPSGREFDGCCARLGHGCGSWSLFAAVLLVPPSFKTTRPFSFAARTGVGLHHDFEVDWSLQGRDMESGRLGSRHRPQRSIVRRILHPPSIRRFG